MTVYVKDLVDNLRIECAYGTEELLKKPITTADITRPGLEMTGYFDYYAPERIQLIGMKEWSYLTAMTAHNRYQVLSEMFQPETPVVIVARGLEIPEEMYKAAKEKQIAICRSKTATSRLSGELSSYLDSRLAQRTSVHGVLMDIYGMGVLIQGDSGIGKSETGLELVKRGHRLVADDRVDVFAKDDVTLWGEPAEIPVLATRKRNVNDVTLWGEPAEILRHLLEIRGVGIIDVMSLYGASAVKESSEVQLAVYLENFETGKVFDRLGNSGDTIEIAGITVPQIRIPVKTGRNISVVIEAAAMNYRAKQMGFDATKLFEERLSNLIEHNRSEN
ncbi:MAG: HPr kinase/phosphorylase [Streptococcus suis]